MSSTTTLPPLRKAYVAPSTGRFAPPPPSSSSSVTKPAVTKPFFGSARFAKDVPAFATPLADDTVPEHLLDTTLHLVDPQVKSGKLPVTLRQTTATRGRRDWLAAHAMRQELSRDLSVCCLFQDGRCKAAAGCRQIHVERAVIQSLRAERQGLVTCCLKCGDAASTDMPEASNLFAAVKATGCQRAQLEGQATAGMPALKVSQLGYTRGLQSMVDEQLLDISAGKPLGVAWTAVCRLHLKASCKYGRDCKNIHICSKIGPLLLSRAAANVNAVVPHAMQMQAEECTRTVFELTPTKSSKAHSPADLDAVLGTSDDSLDLESPSRRTQTTQPPSPVPEQQQLPPPMMQPRAPAALREAFPILDEGSLRMRDIDLENMTFNLDNVLGNTLGLGSTPTKANAFLPSESSPIRATPQKFAHTARAAVSKSASDVPSTPFMATPQRGAWMHASVSPASSAATPYRNSAFHGDSPMATNDLFLAAGSPQSTAWRPSAAAQRLF